MTTCAPYKFKAGPACESHWKGILYSMLFFLQTSGLVLGQADAGRTLMAPARQGGMWGYINPKGDWVIAPEYGEAKNFSENLAEVVMYHEDNIISGFIDRSNRVVIQLPDINYSSMSEGMLAFLEKGVYGYMDSTGRKVIPAQFRFCSGFSSGKAMVVFRNGKAGYINRNKQLLISPRWDTAFGYSGKFAVVGKRDPQGKFKYGIIDPHGNILIPVQYSFITSLNEDKTFANMGGVFENGKFRGGKWYLVNMSRQSMMPLCDTTINNAIVSNSGFIRFKDGLTWFPGYHKGELLFGLMNESGDWVVLPKYKFVNHISESLAGVYAGGKMGFIDTGTGKNIIPCKYDFVGVFHNGLAGFREGRKYGFLSNKGEVVIPPTFDEVGDFIAVE